MVKAIHSHPLPFPALPQYSRQFLSDALSIFWNFIFILWTCCYTYQKNDTFEYGQNPSKSIYGNVQIIIETLWCVCRNQKDHQHQMVSNDIWRFVLCRTVVRQNGRYSHFHANTHTHTWWLWLCILMSIPMTKWKTLSKFFLSSVYKTIFMPWKTINLAICCRFPGACQEDEFSFSISRIILHQHLLFLRRFVVTGFRQLFASCEPWAWALYRSF